MSVHCLFVLSLLLSYVVSLNTSKDVDDAIAFQRQLFQLQLNDSSLPITLKPWIQNKDVVEQSRTVFESRLSLSDLLPLTSIQLRSGSIANTDWTWSVDIPLGVECPTCVPERIPLHRHVMLSAQDLGCRLRPSQLLKEKEETENLTKEKENLTKEEASIEKVEIEKETKYCDKVCQGRGGEFDSMLGVCQFHLYLSQLCFQVESLPSGSDTTDTPDLIQYAHENETQPFHEQPLQQSDTSPSLDGWKPFVLKGWRNASTSITHLIQNGKVGCPSFTQPTAMANERLGLPQGYPALYSTLYSDSIPFQLIHVQDVQNVNHNEAAFTVVWSRLPSTTTAFLLWISLGSVGVVCVVVLAVRQRRSTRDTVSTPPASPSVWITQPPVLTVRREATIRAGACLTEGIPSQLVEPPAVAARRGSFHS